jgi:hypothetical protein
MHPTPAAPSLAHCVPALHFVTKKKYVFTCCTFASLGLDRYQSKTKKNLKDRGKKVVVEFVECESTFTSLLVDDEACFVAISLMVFTNNFFRGILISKEALLSSENLFLITPKWFPYISKQWRRPIF